MRRLSTAAAHWAGRLRGRAESDAPTWLLCALLLATIWSAQQLPAVPDDDEPLTLKVTFFDGVDSVRYELADPAAFDADVLLAIHRQFYGPAVPADTTNAGTDTDKEP